MKAQLNVERVEPRQVWFVPDARIKTRSAAAEAIRLAEQLTHSMASQYAPDDQTLFAAMHTCAYQFGRKARGREITEQQRADWLDRWQTIRSHIVEQNLGLAYSMMSRFSTRLIDEDDLLSDAMLGLTRAVDRFNPWRGYRFSTYACNVIVRALMRRGKRERNRRRLFPVQYDVSLERPSESPDLDREVFVERLSRVLDHNLGSLTDLETRILSRRFPSEHGERQTFQEIGDAVGLSKERVRQIQNIAIRKLRQVLASDPVLQ